MRSNDSFCFLTQLVFFTACFRLKIPQKSNDLVEDEFDRKFSENFDTKGMFSLSDKPLDKRFLTAWT